MSWSSVDDKTYKNTPIIIISEGLWVAVGNWDGMDFISTMGIHVPLPRYWHPVPLMPLKLSDGSWHMGYDWISFNDSTPPKIKSDPFSFLIIDEEVGVAEAEYWNGVYQSDTMHVPHEFNKPLFWRPFPRFPFNISGLHLQV